LSIRPLNDLSNNLVYDFLNTNDNMIDFSFLLGYLDKNELKTDDYKKNFPNNNLQVGYTYSNKSNVLLFKERYMIIELNGNKSIRENSTNTRLPILMRQMFRNTF
jgi:hypothetical protein